MVTSSAVVGSSAISRAGLQISAIAIIARCRMPPDNSNGYIPNTRAGLVKPTCASISSQRSRCSAGDMVVWMRNASAIWLPTVCSGENEVIGS